MLPPVGLELNQLDSIQKKLVEVAALVQPTVNYGAQPVTYDGKDVLIIWATIVRTRLLPALERML